MPAQSALTVLTSLAPYHLLAWGSLLGMQLYQSQIMTKLCYQNLPMPQFTQLQRKVFPVYFNLQTALTLLVVASYPPYSVLSLLKGPGPPPVWSAIVPLGLSLGTSVLNWAVYGPRTSETMMNRIRQETVDGRRSGSEEHGEPPEEMKKLKKAFSRAHAMSIHLNAISMVGTVWYGVGLAAKIRIP